MTHADEILLLSIITAHTGCDLQAAHYWLDSITNRLESADSLDSLETLEDLERFVVDFLADYKECSA